MVKLVLVTESIVQDLDAPEWKHGILADAEFIVALMDQSDPMKFAVLRSKDGEFNALVVRELEELPTILKQIQEASKT